MTWFHGKKPVLGSRLAVSMLAVGVCGCSMLPGGGHSPDPTGNPPPGHVLASSSPTEAGTISPRPVHAAALKPLPAKPARCRQPPNHVNDFRAPTKRSSWKLIAVDDAYPKDPKNPYVDDTDNPYAYLEQVSAAADGTLWALYDVKPSWKDVYRPDRLRRWNGEAWQTFDVPPPPLKSINPQSFGELPVDIALAMTSAQQVHVFNVVERTEDSSSATTSTFGTVVHTYTEGRWRSENLPVTEPAPHDLFRNPVAADGSWVTLFGRRMLRWDGSSWQLHTLTSPNSLNDDTRIFSDDDAKPWVNVQLLRLFSYEHMFQPGMLRWEGAGWREIGLPKLGLPSPPEEITENELYVEDVAVLSADDVWVAGTAIMTGHVHEGDETSRPLALHWDGNSWTCHWSAPDDRDLEHVEPDGAGGMWMMSTDSGELLHLSDGRWTRERLPVPDGCKAYVSALVRRPASQEVYAVGGIYHPSNDKRVCREFSHRRAALWRTG
ncbi:hypothetical protein [Nonomuraea fuscirosea]|uniref:hypothetical protein n=1 Tax=Nonomuraea fuscirosea TaxID=1291556 RepID=UPI0033D1978C